MRSTKPIVHPRDDREAKVIAYWRESGLREETMGLYTKWARRFRDHCRSQGLSELKQCTRSGANGFIHAFRGSRGRRPHCKGTKDSARVALHAWSHALKSLGLPVPRWQETPPAPYMPPVVAEFIEFRKHHRGVAPATIARDISIASEFLDHLRSLKRGLLMIRARDLDSFVDRLSARRCRRIVASDCSSLRSFLRFLQTTGRIRKDLSAAVSAPRYRMDESLPRSLPWDHVRRILRAIPRDTAIGRRDFAMLLMMAAYGLGGAEVARMCFEDISWEGRVLKVRRQKTGVPFELPLLPAVGRAIAAYLKHGRPCHAASREVFIRMRMPYERISSQVLGHQVRGYARLAGIDDKRLGSHSFRHSHATRQIDWGASHKIVADILGHKKPASTKVYIRVALRRLRTIALPVPR